MTTKKDERTTFDRDRGRQLAFDGMALAEDHRKDVRDQAHEIAVHLARLNGEVDMDQVQARLIALGYDPAELGNAAGSVFRNGFVWTGRVKVSARVSRHANLIRIWKLKGKAATGE